VAVRLEPAEFNLLWSGLAVGARPLELHVPAQGATRADAARLTARATETLRERDLLLGGEPAPRVADLLHLMAGRTAQVDLRWAPGPGLPELRGLVALRGKHGALALWDGEQVTLRRVRPVVFVEELVGVLGEMPAGGGRSVSLPADVLARASRDGAGDVERFQRRLVSNGVSRDDARALREFSEARRLRAGQFGASGVDQWGKHRRVPWVIHVLDTDRGRYATYERGGYRTFVGVDSGWLVAVVRELYADAVRDRRNS
jgi:hypothetical protein